MKKKLSSKQIAIMDAISINENYIRLGVNGDRVVDRFGGHMLWVAARTFECMLRDKMIVRDKKDRTKYVINPVIKWPSLE